MAGSTTRFFLKHELSDYCFIVDTGAFRSILPSSRDNTSIYPSSSCSSQPIVYPFARKVNRKSASISLVGHTLGPSSLLTCVTNYSALTLYYTSTWCRCGTSSTLQHRFIHICSPVHLKHCREHQ